MPSTLALPLSHSRAAPAPRWLRPCAVALLGWNFIALLGALADYGDAQQAAPHASFASTWLHFVLLHLPLMALSLVLSIRFDRAGPRRPGLAFAGGLLCAVPLLYAWQAVMNNAFAGRPIGTPLDWVARQGALTLWWDALVLLIACCAHLAAAAWMQAHGQALASQRAEQANLDLRLRLLQGQLEPYFLSGALRRVGELARTGQFEQATRALARLSDLLRYALRASQSDWQSVADEIQFLREYVELQGICRGAPLSVSWNIGSVDWTGYRCPSLLLFPMLEQALGGPAGAITVDITAAAGMVNVAVRCPDGAGRDSEALAAMRERLAMPYGQSATLDLRDGACMQLRYPVSHHDD